MEYNNECHYPLMNGTISTSNYSSVSTLTSPSITSINDKVCPLQDTIHKNINYSDLSKLNQHMFIVQVVYLRHRSNYYHIKHGIL